MFIGMTVTSGQGPHVIEATATQEQLHHLLDSICDGTSGLNQFEHLSQKHEKPYLSANNSVQETGLSS